MSEASRGGAVNGAQRQGRPAREGKVRAAHSAVTLRASWLAGWPLPLGTRAPHVVSGSDQADREGDEHRARCRVRLVAAALSPHGGRWLHDRGLTAGKIPTRPPMSSMSIEFIHLAVSGPSPGLIGTPSARERRSRSAATTSGSRIAWRRWAVAGCIHSSRRCARAPTPPDRCGRSVCELRRGSVRPLSSVRSPRAPAGARPRSWSCRPTRRPRA